MSLSEFELIQRFFSDCGAHRPDVRLGVGDDCALLSVPAGKELAVTIDTLVEGVHFPVNTDPESIGHKSLAVNLSDLAAMGAEPAWVTLALTLPAVDAVWLKAFCKGFARLAAAYNVQLVGGDTTRGPLSISVQAHGFVDAGCALRRNGARPGDWIYVTGTLGDAGLALRLLEGEVEPMDALPYVQPRLDRPTPRVVAGMALVGLAGAAIDISDGLMADLGHICENSAVGASLFIDDLPCSPAVHAYIEAYGDWTLPLACGDDYELCFTVSPERSDEVESLFCSFECDLTRIGRIETRPGIRCLDSNGRQLESMSPGYEHFSRGN